MSSRGEAEEEVVRHAQARGFVTAAQVLAARASAHGGSGALAHLRPFLTSDQLAELTVVYRAAVAGPGPGGGPDPDEVETLAEAPRAPGGSRPGAAGARVGPYVIERELARGGMGVVSIARHAEVGRRVALKQLLPRGRANATLQQRFVREGVALAKLSHPGIVGVYDAGQTPTGLYLAMELVDGEALDAKVGREGPLAARDAVAIVEQVARAVAYAHDQGVLHRDLKPANVLLTPDGVAKVTDFGLARDADDQSLTQTGIMIGTPAFMPLEQRAGEHDSVDERSDVFALGATLLALVSGEPPPPARGWAGDDVGLATVVDVCLEPMREDRYPTAHALADDLGRYLRGEPVLARRPSRLRRARSWGRRHRRWVGAGATAAVALLVSGVAAASLLGGTAAAPPVVSLTTADGVSSDERVEVVGRVAGLAPPFRVRLEVLTAGRSERTAVLVLDEPGEFRRRLRLGPGLHRLSVTAEDAAGVVGDAEARWRIDLEPPRVTFEAPPRWLSPVARLTGVVSEPGCTLSLGDWSARIEGTRLDLELPYAVTERQEAAWIEDPAGNRVEAGLPFQLVKTAADLVRVQRELTADRTIFLAPGDYALDEAGLTGEGALGSLAGAVSGVGPLPADLLEPAGGRQAAILTGELVQERQSRVPRLLFGPRAGLIVDLPPGAGFILRSVSVARTPAPTAAVHVVQGSLLLDGVAIRSEPAGVLVGEPRAKSGAAPVAHVRIVGGAFVASQRPAIRVRPDGRVVASGARLVGILSATAAARGLEYTSRRALVTSLVQVEGGGFRGEESRFQDYPGVGIVAETGSDVRLTRCTVRGNASSGVWANGARVALEECRLEENFAEGLLIQRGGVVVAERCTFDHNGVRGERGHGVGVLGAGAGTVLRDCVFVHHDLTGVRVVPSRPGGGPITIEGGELTQNGVGLELIGSGRVDLRGVRIHHNLGDGVRAESSAGHLSVGHLEACEVTDNGFGGEGYGVRRDRLSAVELVETRVSGNRSGPSRIVPSLR